MRVKDYDVSEAMLRCVLRDGELWMGAFMPCFKRFIFTSASVLLSVGDIDILLICMSVRMRNEERLEEAESEAGARGGR